MKIVITSNYELGNETGSAKVAEDLAEKLSLKNKVLLICLGKKFKEYERSKNLRVVEITSIIINNIYVPIITPIIMYQIFRKLDLFAPNVVHAQNSVLVSSLVQTWSYLKKVPFVVTFHHVPTEPIKHLVPHLSKNVLLTLVQEIYKSTNLDRFLKKSDLVIAQNDLIKKSIRTVNKRVKIETINNGIEIIKLNKIKPRKQNIDFKFTFLGSYNSRKNQAFLIKTFKYLPKKYSLNLHGSFKSGGTYLESLNKLTDKLKLKNVFINDFEKNIEKVFKKTDFLLSASKKEAQSLAVLQSLAAGKPIIGVKNETISEVVNNKNGLVVSRSITPKVFASEIVKYVNDIDYKKTSKQCIQDSKRFDINLVISKIENVYQRLTNSSSNNC